MACRFVVLASGRGTNLQAILEAIDDRRLDGEVVLVVTDRPGAGCVARAHQAGAPVAEVPVAAGETRIAYDRRLADLVATAEPDWIILAGWMRLLSSAFLDRFPSQVVNLHPARPGELPGTRAIERAFDEFRGGVRSVTGVMVHFVPDEGVDDGPVIATVDVPIHPDDSLDSLRQRVQHAEHRLLVSTLADLTRPSRQEADA